MGAEAAALGVVAPAGVEVTVVDYGAEKEARFGAPQVQMFTVSLCVFVDDSRHYLPPAADLGMETILAEDPKQTVSQLEALFDATLLGAVCGGGRRGD